jgi:hypothetical protein
MQQTRLNTLLFLLAERIGDFFSNPWRRLSLTLICLLFGFFSASAVSTFSGQEAMWDVTVSLLILILSEAISIVVYGSNSKNKKRQSLFWSCLNYFKLGVIYGLFLEALKLGS